MATPSRLGIRGRQVELYVRFVDAAGNPVNADSTPKVEIIDYNGTSRRGLSNRGISLADDPGLYLFNYEIPLSGPDGYWNDRWVAVIGGEEVENTFEFQVLEGGSATATEFPKHEPGDDVEFCFTKEEIYGINLLMKVLKKRLKSDGVRRVPDPDDPSRYIEEPCPVFKDSELICFLVNGLSEFNQYPHFTNFTFADAQIQGIFLDIVVQGALILALAAQALIEKGREFSITDNGVTYQPAAISDILSSQYSAQLQDYKEKLKMIKASLKPGPLGLGTFRVTAVNPNFLRLRHLRERQII